MHVTPAYEKLVLNSRKSLCLFRKDERAYASISCSEAVIVKPSYECRTRFWKACVCFSMGLLRLHSTGLCEACWPMSDSLQVRECVGEGENSWKEPCSCHRARRLPVRSVPITQGKGDWKPKDCSGDREGAYS
jgi:hypothetical protein